MLRAVSVTRLSGETTPVQSVLDEEHHGVLMEIAAGDLSEPGVIANARKEAGRNTDAA